MNEALSKNVQVVLEDSLLKDCHRWGTERVEENKDGKNAKAYDHDGKMPWDNLQANRYAVVGEVAVAGWLGFDPYSLTWVFKKVNGKYDKSLHTDADIRFGAYKVEVRNTSDPSQPIYVKHKDIKADALVLQVHVELGPDKRTPTGRVILVGWVWAKSAKRLGTYNKDRHYYEVSNKNKKPMFLFPKKKAVAS